jgi:putative transposase
VTRMCRIAQVARASYYRGIAVRQLADGDTELRDVIQKIALAFPAYGYRRITAELRRRRYPVNHKRTLRIMKEDNLLCLRRKSFTVTTNSKHGFPVYPNLATALVADAVNKLWVADITYIRLQLEFVYLAVVLDAYSRRVVGWALSGTLEAELTLGALRMAISKRRPKAGLTHHSDRGMQYACGTYTDLLRDHGIRISMSRAGNPYDNPYAESFIKTLKYEEVYRAEYPNLAVAAAEIGKFIEKVYNQKRLHSALGYRPPAEFEEAVR